MRLLIRSLPRVAVVGTVAATVFATYPAAQAAPGGGGGGNHLNTSSRAAVARGFRTQFRPAYRTRTGFTGNVAGCRAGHDSRASLRATRNAINYARSLNHLDPVSFTPTLNAKAQRAALLMDANGKLSHNPPRGWKCWSGTAASAASKSDILLRYPHLNSGQITAMYLRDAGAANTDVGHRRWLMYPNRSTMGSGSTGNANAVYVLGPTRPGRSDPAFTSWPSSGWFPSNIEPAGRWSLSSGHAGTSFANAHISVVRVTGSGTQKVGVRRYAVVNGYGEPTIVWHMGAGFQKSGTYRVSVRGITGPGPSHHTYTVRLFRVS